MNYFTKVSFWEKYVVTVAKAKLCLCALLLCVHTHTHIYINKSYNALMIFWDAMNIDLFLKKQPHLV